MLFALWIIEILVGILLILAVLIQVGRGEGMGALFGGGGTQSVFGPTGPATLLEKITYGLIAIFFITTIAITKLSVGIGKIEAPEQVVPEAPAPEEVLPDIPENVPDIPENIPEPQVPQTQKEGEEKSGVNQENKQENNQY